jgi:sugar phosphate isomerase/epimerase
MQHFVSTHFFINHRLNTVWLEKIRAAGVPALEIFCARQHLDYRDTAQIVELGHWFRDSTMKLHSLHSPMYNDDCWGRTGPNAVITITEPIKHKRIVMVDEIKRAIEVSEKIPFRYLIQHIGVGGEEYDDRKIDAAFNSLEELNIFARQRGVEILLENIPNRLSSGERLVSFLAQTHLDLGFCFDTGHAHLMDGVEATFEVMKSRIRSTHVHDNDGKNDIHLFPSLSDQGTIDWKKTMELLRSRDYQYPLLLELKESPDIANPFEGIQRVFEYLENC